MKPHTKTLLAGLTASLALVGTANAAPVTVLADDFAGVSKTGSTATITAWDTENGVTATTSFPAVNDGGSPADYFDVQAGELDVNASVWDTADGWDISFDVAVSGATASVELSSLDLTSWSINNSGGKRNNSGAHAWTLTITGDGAYGTQSASADAAYGDDQWATASIDLSGLGDLVAGENYTFTLGVRQSAANPGDKTYATLDDFTLSGTAVVIPEPASGAMALVGLGALAARRRRRG